METESTIVGNLDLSDERDRGTLRRAVDDGPKRRRWGGITDELKAKYVAALNVALRLALEHGDNRGIRGCVDTLAKLEGQNQADEHLADKNARIDAGKATDSLTVVPTKFIEGVDESKL